MTANVLSDLRPLIEGMKGHNYALPDCMKYLFERVGAYGELDFWQIAAMTGDTVAQVYNRGITTSCEYCVSGYLAGPEHIAYVFDAFGFSHDYSTSAQVAADAESYLTKVAGYIDRGIPVLVKTNLNDIPAWHSDVGTYGLIVGYDLASRTVKLNVEGTSTIDCVVGADNKLDLIFIGDRTRDVTLAELYIAAIKKMPHWLTLPERGGMCFGAVAYRAWADDIASGRFADDTLPLWENYGVYICNLATSGSEQTFIFRRLSELDPAYAGLEAYGAKIRELLPAESPTGGRCRLWIDLEALGGGMDMGQVRATMRDSEKRAKVADALRDYAARLDKALAIYREVAGLL